VRSRYPEAELAADRAIHVVAILVGAVGALAMVARALVFANARTFSAVVVYTLALLAMLCASAAHNCGPTRAGTDLRRRVDHAAIFVMIAATYTPFTLAGLSDCRAIGLTAAIWTVALGGALVKLRYRRRFERLSIVVYLALGWQGLFLVPSLFGALPEPAALLIVTGGVLYSAGAGFHIWTTLPFHNAIWHGFVVIAAGCHYTAIWQALLLASTRP
jgi:hemolysin III